MLDGWHRSVDLSSRRMPPSSKTARRIWRAAVVSSHASASTWFRASIYLAQPCQRLRGLHPRGQRQSLGIRSPCPSQHPGSQPGGCRRHRSSHHSRQAKRIRSSCNRNDEVRGVWRRRQKWPHIYNLFPSKLRPGGAQGQEEALRPPRRRQLFVSASHHSIFGIFPERNYSRK